MKNFVKMISERIINAQVWLRFTRPGTMRHFFQFLHANVGNVSWMGVASVSRRSTLSFADLYVITS